MDEDILNAVKRHRAKFGKFNANIVTLDFDAPGFKQQFLYAVEKAIETGVPISDESLGISFPDGVMI